MARPTSTSKKEKIRTKLQHAGWFPSLSPVLKRSLFIVTVYLVFGLSWIFITDSINFTRLDEISSMAIVSSIKGSLYVVLTAGLIFALVYPAFKKISANQVQLAKSNTELINERIKLLQSEKKLRASETLLRAIFDQATVGISIGYSEETIAPNDPDKPGVNPAFLKITGRTVTELQGIPWGDLTHPDDLKDDFDRLEKLKTGDIYDTEKRLIMPDGSHIWVHMILSPVYVDSGSGAIQLCIIEDISRRKELEMSLNEHVRSRTVLLDNLQGMAFRCLNNEQRTIQYVSQGGYTLTGYKQESIMGGDVSYCDMIVPQYRQSLRNKWDAALASKTRFREEYEIMTSSGQYKWVLEQGEGVVDEYGNTVALEGLIVDITKQKEQELMFKYFSEHDFNTGLANRRYFKNFVSRELLLKQAGANHAMILVHISKMNLLNLTRGFLFSEQLVKELSIVLSRLCSSNCSLFQIAVDRFLFYVKEYEDRHALTSICESVMGIFEQRMSRLYVQIGIVEIDGDNSDADNLLKYASIAAAGSGRERYTFFNNDMEALLQRRETIIGELSAEAHSDKTDKLFVEYQPLIETASRKIMGFEALARFKSAAFGLVPPTEFIAVAEEEQLIIPLGRKIILQAFDFMKTLRDSGNENICMSINLSAIQLLCNDFIPDLKKIIAEKAVTPQNLIVEITESVFVDNFTEINEKLEELSAMGIKVAIDDFGTGYSSLARERELNVNCLKIDKYFIDNLSNNDGKTITSDIISMAHKLGHCVVAEGVENEVQEQYLAAHQCDFMQGYLFSRPLPRLQALRALQNMEVHHGGL